MTTQFNLQSATQPNVPAVATLLDNVSKKVYKFPFNVNSLQWVYNMKTQSFSTIGGRVTQLLSVAINTMNVQGEAGSREKLLNLYEQFKTVQDNQNTNKVSMTFSVPSQGLSWNVWLELMQIGWDATTLTYPYIIYFEVDQDLSSSTSNSTTAATHDALNRIAKGIGFNGDWTGITTQNVNLQFSQVK